MYLDAVEKQEGLRILLEGFYSYSADDYGYVRLWLGVKHPKQYNYPSNSIKYQNIP